jgi:hypothetical protein
MLFIIVCIVGINLKKWIKGVVVLKKVLFGVVFALSLFFTSQTTYAADTQIKIDGVTITSDVLPEMKDNRTMVPLRVISENLGANVIWSRSEVTLTKNDMKVTLNLNSTTALKNGERIALDVKPYIKNNRLIVPLRFIAETFGCKVNYSNSTVTVDTKPLFINGGKVKALQYEFHMTFGGRVQQIRGNAYIESLYNIFAENIGSKVEAPESYSWRFQMLDAPGSYCKTGQYDFFDAEDKSLKRFDIYTLLILPAENLEAYPEVLIHDATEDQWFLFNEAARQSIYKLIDTASKNGFLEIIDDSIV